MKEETCFTFFKILNYIESISSLSLAARLQSKWSVALLTAGERLSECAFSLLDDYFLGNMALKTAAFAEACSRVIVFCDESRSPAGIS